jgi:endonuclease YncB( thermonuclease family)
VRFSFGPKVEDTLQFQMVRSGCAVVRGSDPTPLVETVTGGGRSFDITISPMLDPPSTVEAFGKPFLDRLLAAQEEARRKQLGVWRQPTAE